MQPTGLQSASLGQRRVADWLGRLRVSTGQSLSFGIAYEETEFGNRSATFAAANFDASDRQSSAYFEYAAQPLGYWNITLSGRFDDNRRFANARTFRLATNLDLGAVSVHSSIGQGITNPTFFELFGFVPASFVGNPALLPEESVSFDLGVRTRVLDGKVDFDATYFQADLENEIATVFNPDFTSTAVNGSGRSKRRGAELELSAQLSQALRAQFSYTYLSSRDTAGRQEVRRPRHSGSATLLYRFADQRGNATVSWTFNGTMQDNEFIFATPEDRATLQRFSTLDATVSWKASDQLTLFARGENLTDEKFSEVFGFRSVGRAGRVGLSWRL